MLRFFASAARPRAKRPDYAELNAALILPDDPRRLGVFQTRRPTSRKRHREGTVIRTAQGLRRVLFGMVRDVLAGAGRRQAPKCDSRRAVALRELGSFEDILLFPGGLAYVTVPKAANTSVKYFLANALVQWSTEELATLQADRQAIHRLLRKRYRITRAQLAERKRNSQVASFSVVRDPQTRFFSFYADKIASRGWGEPVYERLMEAYGIAQGDDFEKVLRVVINCSDRDSEIHFRSQRALLYEGGECLVDDVFRMERIADLWGFLVEFLRVQGVDARPPTQKANVSGSGNCKVTEKQCELLRARYRADYETFGY